MTWLDRLKRCLTLGEADKQVVQYEGAGENSYRRSIVKALAGLAAYPWALGGQKSIVVKLESDRLIFRDHEPADLDAYCEIESDPQYRWPQVVHPRAELERSFAQAWLPAKSMGLLAAVLKSENRYIGRCGLYPRRDEVGNIVDGEAEIAFYIGRPDWGQGLATEAARAFVQYGFGTLDLRRIYAGINAKNAASLRVAHKAGFVLVRSGEGGGSTWHELELVNPADTPAL